MHIEDLTENTDTIFLPKYCSLEVKVCIKRRSVESLCTQTDRQGGSEMLLKNICLQEEFCPEIQAFAAES